MTDRTIPFTLNNRPVTAVVKPHHNLIDLLAQFDLRGARESCGQGLCGCCTVLVDGDPVSGCLYFASRVDGKSVSTVEALDAAGELSAVQQAFIDKGAYQCGFCTSGFVLMAHDLLKRNADPTDDDIRNHLNGNLCRCGTYPEVIEAIKAVAARR
jgi:carbon-monoxide dehydrogenase small subunit